MKTRGNRRYLLLVVLFIFLMLYLFITKTNLIQRIVYPFHYREIIEIEADKNNQDPRLIAAIIWVESRFKKDARSSKGALGLMQVMPQTGRWVAEQAGFALYSDETLMEPEVNIAIGTWYFQKLITTFDGNKHAALAAYNGGQGHAARWLESGVWDGTLENVHAVPFPETRQFVIKVDKTYQRYKELYN